MLVDNRFRQDSTGPWKIILAVTGTLATLMMALRVNQDGAPLAAYLRFLSRGVLFGLVGTAIAALATLPVMRILRDRARRMSQLKSAAVIGFLLGIAVNAALTWYMTSFDSEIRRRMTAATKLSGFIEFRMAGYPPITLMQTPQEGYVRREPVDPEMPDFITALLESAEDKRFSTRISPIDVEALGRVVFRVANGQRQGGSGFPEQLAGLLFDLHPKGLDPNSIRSKIKKFLLGVRIDEQYTRSEITQAYLTIVPFGSVRGFEISGIEAAALTFFDRRARDLSIGQAAVLLSMLPSPTLYLPYQRRNEPDEAFEKRMSRLRERSIAVINNAAERGRITAAEATEAQGRLLEGLAPFAQAVAALRRPRLRAVFSELNDVQHRTQLPLTVELAWDSRAQRALEDAIESALQDIRLLPAVRRHDNAPVTIDAVVLSTEGGILAETGLSKVRGGGSSIIKPAYVAAALESHLVTSVRDFIPETRIRLDEMLYASINEGAERLSEGLGPTRMVPFLRPFGFAIPAERISPKNALGAGGLVSPCGAAEGFVFHFGRAPGRTIPCRLIVAVRDRETGQTLERPMGVQIVSLPTAVAVRSVLERTSTEGTARGALAELAAQGAIAAKTGTAGFFSSEIGRYVGEGGSWTVAADSRSFVVIAVRARYVSSAPFEPNGSISAALVVRNFLNRYRDVESVHAMEVTE
jgi:membrane peptidoglycan carboxypeptidase